MNYMKPSRNKIVFTGIPDEFTVNLCNEKIQKYIRENTFREGEIYSIDLYENEFKIFKSKNTFHQNDDNIQKELYNIIFPILKREYENVLLIGGECYIFGSLIHAKNIYSYSDSYSIVEDCKRNTNRYGGNIEAKLVNYSDIEIQEIKYDICILNVSKKGLGKHLSSFISTLNVKEKYYISCNEKSFLRDNFKIKQKWEIRNPLYGITLYHII
jgi:tRNA/tmRNA/rRNA uracil-C5-methylase (TrmA/RlmC/RlmD family)